MFIDSPVMGLEYRSGSQSGVTDAFGTFVYEVDEPVVFQLGGIGIGQSRGAPVITPVDLVADAQDETNSTIVNITRFLMSLDANSNPSDGIAISDTYRMQATDLSLGFASQSFDGGASAIVSVALPGKRGCFSLTIPAQ